MDSGNLCTLLNGLTRTSGLREVRVILWGNTDSQSRENCGSLKRIRSKIAIMQ